MKVLLIEDNRTIAQQVIEFLSAHNWDIDYAATGQQGINLALNDIYDVILLDLNLPDVDGLDVCAAIQKEITIHVPILMLTARDSFEHKAEGFNQGADDYLTKPFDLRELVLRCQALAKRSSLHKEKLQKLGELTINHNTRQVFRNNTEIGLTKIGFEIIVTLADAHPNPVSKSYLLHKLWPDQLPESDALKSHIYSLRQAVDKSFDFAMIQTIKGAGYRLDIGDSK